jgi:hypothetical protein
MPEGVEGVSCDCAAPPARPHRDWRYRQLGHGIGDGCRRPQVDVELLALYGFQEDVRSDRGPARGLLTRPGVGLHEFSREENNLWLDSLPCDAACLAHSLLGMSIRQEGSAQQRCLF